MADVVPQPSNRHWLVGSGDAARFFGALFMIAAIIGGIVLALHKGHDCVANPYDDSLTACTTTHPYISEGIGAMCVGLVQGFTLLLVGGIATAVGESKVRA